MTKRRSAREIPKLPKGIYTFDPTLYLRVQATGARSWIQRIHVDGKQVDRGLGGWPLVTLEEARLTALANRRAVRAGRNPFVGADDTRTAGRTFGAAWDSLMATLAGKSAGTLKSYASVGNNLATLRNRPVASLSRGEVIHALKSIASVHSRGKAVKLIRRVLDHAVVLEWAPSNVADNGGLAAAVGVEAQAPSHHRAAPAAEAPGIFHRLTAAGSAAADCLAFVFLTAARMNEAAGAQWSEIDLSTATWTVPATRMKAGRDHRVALSPAAVAILERRRGQHDTNVFGARVPNQTALARLAKPYTTHGARATFATWAADNGFDHVLIEAAQAHVTGNSVSRCYQRSDLLDRRRPMMDAWGRFLTA